MISIYHPYFRGKQFELLVIRENVDLLLRSNFCPIIEPVNSTLNSLRKTIESLAARRAPYILIANTKCTSEAVASPAEFIEMVKDSSSDEASAQIGVLMNEKSDVDEFLRLTSAAQRPIAIIHDGFSDGKALAEAANGASISAHIFVESKCSKLYRRHFTNAPRVLIRDGFRKRAKNSEYPPFEEFSDLHLLYDSEEGMDGFGDYLIAGNEYSEGGGPAWAIAIHVTVIDSGAEDRMMIHHFVSDSNTTSNNPAGKFIEALGKLAGKVTAPNSKIQRTASIREFLALHEEQRFPGLGYVKKLSMAHHLETMSAFLGR